MFTQNVARALFPLGLDQRGSDPHPRQPAPMLLQRADKVRTSPGWLFEPKWDGFRVLASVRDGAVRLVSRNGHSFTNLFGPITDALRGPQSRSTAGGNYSTETYFIGGLGNALTHSSATRASGTNHTWKQSLRQLARIARVLINGKRGERLSA